MLRGEVWLINLDPTIGAEIKKVRPVAIVSSDFIGILPLRVVIPLTDWKENYKQAAWMVKVRPSAFNGLGKNSAADTFQIRSVSTTRFIRKIGEITHVEMNQIAKAIGLVIEYPSQD
ncbi:MAG: PemK family transcriptional regulator [Chloroflexi bacterium 44-23]|nr:MAG: PemK family transcriptional regulator [Chloroflexi bacterium 44-23]